MTEATKTTKKRRSPEEIVADLQAKIESVKRRAAAKEAKADPVLKQVSAAARALSKAEKAAREAGDKELAGQLDSAHEAVVVALRGRSTM